MTVDYSESPSSSFTYFCSYYLTGNFTNTSGNASSYFWEFGDGETSTEENPIHNYASVGFYTVTLTTTFCGVESQVTMVVETDQFQGLNTNQNSQFSIYPNPSNVTVNMETLDF